MPRPSHVLRSVAIFAVASALVSAAFAQSSGPDANPKPAASERTAQPWVTIQAKITDERDRALLNPIMVLKPGQRCDLSVNRIHSEVSRSAQLNLSVQLISCNGDYHHIGVDAEMVSADSPWSFQTTTFVRADQPVTFRWSGPDGEVRTLCLSVLDVQSPAGR